MPVIESLAGVSSINLVRCIFLFTYLNRELKDNLPAAFSPLGPGVEFWTTWYRYRIIPHRSSSCGTAATRFLCITRDYKYRMILV